MLEHKWRNPFVEGRDGERVEYHHKATAGTERKGGFEVNDPLSARLAGAGGWGIALIRVMVGIVFLVHGVQKLFLQGFGGVAGFFAMDGGYEFPLLLVVASVGLLLSGSGALSVDSILEIERRHGQRRTASR